MIIRCYHWVTSLPTLTLFSIGICSFIGSGLLIGAHVTAVSDMRDVALPLTQEVTALERRLSALHEQIELRELASATDIHSQKERITMFVLPKEIDLDRTVALFETFHDVFEKKGRSTQMSELIFSASHSEGNIQYKDMTMHVSMHEDALEDFLLLLRISGVVTVGDLFSDEDITLLTEVIERDDPSGIISLEQFLGTDLLQYAKDSGAYKEQLKRSFRTTDFATILYTVIERSLLDEISAVLLSDIGVQLATYNLWPLPMMSLEQITLSSGSEEGWYRADLTIRLYGDSNSSF